MLSSVCTSGSCNGPICSASAAVTAFGSTAAHPTIVAWGGSSAAPASDRYCGPSDSADAATRCTQADLEGASLVLPAAATLRGVAVTLNSAPTTGNSETFEVVRSRGGATMVLTSVQLNPAERSDAASCSGICDLQQGDLVAVHFTRQGSETRFRHIALELSGIGQIVPTRDARTKSVRYGQVHYGLTNGNAYRLDRDARLQNLSVQSTDVAPSADSVFALCTGATDPPPCTGGLTCTLLHGTTHCADSIDHVDLPAGSYFLVKATSQGSTGGRYRLQLRNGRPSRPLRTGRNAAARAVGWNRYAISASSDSMRWKAVCSVSSSGRKVMRK